VVKAKISAARPVGGCNSGAPFAYVRIIPSVHCSAELGEVVKAGTELEKWLNAFEVSVAGHDLRIDEIVVEGCFGQTSVRTEIMLFDVPSYEWLESIGVNAEAIKGEQK